MITHVRVLKKYMLCAAFASKRKLDALIKKTNGITPVVKEDFRFPSLKNLSCDNKPSTKMLH